MESPEDIEKALSKLLPSAYSEQGQQRLDELIDRLAAEETFFEMPEPEKAEPKRRVWAWGIGAAAAAVVVSLSMPPAATGISGETPALVGNPAVVPAASVDAGDGIVLLGQVERVEAAEPEDWVSETDGVAHRAWRFRVVDEELVQDVQTGYEVTVSRPREKVVLMPVTAF